jgi:hypothetical protein
MLQAEARTATGPQVALRVTATGELSVADAGTPTVTLAKGPGVLAYGRTSTGQLVPIAVTADGALRLS